MLDGQPGYDNGAAGNRKYRAEIAAIHGGVVNAWADDGQVRVNDQPAAGQKDGLRRAENRRIKGNLCLCRRVKDCQT